MFQFKVNLECLRNVCFSKLLRSVYKIMQRCIWAIIFDELTCSVDFLSSEY